MSMQRIEWDKMRVLEMPNSARNLRTVAITNKGEIVINAKLVEKMQGEKEQLQVNFYYSEDFKMLAIKQDDSGNVKLPRNGRMKHMEFAKKISKAGFILPIKYSVEWDDTEQLWLAILQEKYLPLDVDALMSQKKMRKKS